MIQFRIVNRQFYNDFITKFHVNIHQQIDWYEDIEQFGKSSSDKCS